MAKKKVLIISHGGSLCGAERSLLLLLQHMNRDRFDPLVVLARTGPLEQVLGEMGISTCHIWCPWWARVESDRRSLPRRLGQEVKATIRLCKLIRRERIDLVYTNTFVVFSGALAAFLTRKPHVWHVREILAGNPDLIPVLPQRVCVGLIRALSRTVVVNSRATGRQFGRAHAARGFRVVYNAQPLVKPEPTMQLTDMEGIGADEWLVACVGTLCRIKAPDDAIRAIMAAHEKIPDVRLLLIGDGPSEFTEYLRDLCRDLGVSQRVTFAGFRTDVSSILSRCRVLVMPSWNDSFGRVLIEAMAAGIPVIGVNAGGIPEIIDDGVTGYLVAPRAPEELAQKLIHLHRNPHIAGAMGAAGQNVVAARFNVGTYVQSVEEVLSDTEYDVVA